ncbi:pyrimidine dimer DNA glycosylase/endonuclease V [Rhodanobacter sp. OK091]|uniref:pyrimidine dimer DNA glycosylase/endonuclease V n=1 Tax=Rhodanobacter sp. OK091 TaxID=1881037 RepID=UPI0009247EDF|nr:pyrimidine dimer DNA glycosylase/endonuclease V [Rhodanobacter sp. OK091]SHL71863.1 Pyrimidine dimer DNA glycosylase /DNA-(apurinic or apyrimidinic site) lyase [Rhodanobacter sp. OK091]
MRLWSLHPKYLDTQGLVALWREGLLARAVLRGNTHGYKHHPQLDRFAAHAQPRLAINAYLAGVYAEAKARGYSFDRTKIGPVKVVEPIVVTTGQIHHEWQHLLAKLAVRSPAQFEQWRLLKRPMCHPLLRQSAGPVASWERVQVAPNQSFKADASGAA